MLEKAQKIGMTMNISKCQFKTAELVYLGHKLTGNLYLARWGENKKHNGLTSTWRYERCSLTVGFSELCG